MTIRPALSLAAWHIAKALYDKVLVLPPSEREACIAEEPVDDAIRAEVRSLLAACPDMAPSNGLADGFLNQPANLLDSDTPDRTGERFGPWKLVRPLGTGGMGDVFEVQRADGSYEGRAAIKLLKRGLDSTAVLQRFALERQVLARMHHPHIATLLDAGISADGLPYFVMEYVDGKPIDQAVLGWSVEARLGVFLQLADAVSHAHRQLLVHRDLKPGNVMVGSDGQVKLLDFGIAKALDPKEGSADAASDTALGAQRPFTPNYASPEQVRGEPVSTATDIYSLGVLLYQMLTGLRPTGRDATTPAEAARCVLEEAPTRPSQLNAAQVIDPQWVSTRRRLQGDLDNILLKALEKPVERRYASVDALAQDVRCYLDGLPVSARAPTLIYVSTKLIQRHKLAASLGLMLVISLFTGAAVATWQASQARSRLAGIKGITREAVFRFGDAVTYVPGGMAIKADLLKHLTQVLDKLVDASGDDVDLRGDAAQAYSRLADLEFNETSAALHRAEAGRAHADRSLELARSVPEQKLSDANFLIWYWRALGTRARLQRAQGHPELGLQTLAEVIPLLDRGIAQAERDKAQDAVIALRVERARAHHFTSQILYKPGMSHLNQLPEALHELATARAELVALDVQHPDPEITYLLGSVDGQVAINHEANEDLELALQAATLAMQERRDTLRALPNDVEYRDALTTESLNLGRILMRLQRHEEALKATSTSWDLNAVLEHEHAAGPDNTWTRRKPVLATHHGRALRRAGHPREALPILQAALGHWQKVANDDPNNADAQRSKAWMQSEIAQCLLALGDSKKAQALATEAFDTFVPPKADAYQQRSAWIVKAQLAMAAAGSTQGPLRAQWKQAAGQAFQQAASLRALAGDDQAWAALARAPAGKNSGPKLLP